LQAADLRRDCVFNRKFHRRFTNYSPLQKFLAIFQAKNKRQTLANPDLFLRAK
jgi:hypothetical protein